jgi:hypothetical protein
MIEGQSMTLQEQAEMLRVRFAALAAMIPEDNDDLGPFVFACHLGQKVGVLIQVVTLRDQQIRGLLQAVDEGRRIIGTAGLRRELDDMNQELAKQLDDIRRTLDACEKAIGDVR